MSASKNTSENVSTKLYTGFVKTYIAALVPLSLYGSWLSSDQFSAWYTVYLLIWGLIFKNYWVNYKSKMIANREPDYNSGFTAFSAERRFKVIKNITLTAVILAVLLVGQLATFCLEILLTQLTVVENGYLKMALSLVPTVLTTLLVQIFTLIFNKTVDIKSNYIITIWTSFVPLLITLFVYLPLGYKLNNGNHLADIFVKAQSYSPKWTTIASDFKINQLRFMDQFKYFIITNQVVALGLDNILPKVLKKDVNYAAPLNLKLGYLKYLLNFGFLTIFSNTWSLAPLLSLIFVIINYYIDSYKIKKGNFIVEDDISIEMLLSVFNWIGSLVQPALILMYKRTPLPDVGIPVSDTLWYSKSPITIDVSYILAGSFLIEHLNIGLDKIFGSLSAQKLAKEFKKNGKNVESLQSESGKFQSDSDSISNSVSGSKATGFQTEVQAAAGKEMQLKNVSKIKLEAPKTFTEIPVKASNSDETLSLEKHVPNMRVTDSQNTSSNVSKETNESDTVLEEDMSVGATLPSVIPTSSNYDLRHGLLREPTAELKDSPAEPKEAVSESKDVPVSPKDVPVLPKDATFSPKDATSAHSSAPLRKVVSHHHASKPPARTETLSSQAATASLQKGPHGIENDLGISATNTKKSADTSLTLRSKSKSLKKKKKLFGLKL